MVLRSLLPSSSEPFFLVSRVSALGPSTGSGLSLTWVEQHLVGGACFISVRDRATPCSSQLGFWSVPCLVHALDTRIAGVISVRWWFRQLVIVHICVSRPAQCSTEGVIWSSSRCCTWALHSARVKSEALHARPAALWGARSSDGAET